MQNALLVRGFKRTGDLRGNPHRAFERYRTRLDPIGERLAIDQLHHQVVGADIVNLANVRMIQRCDGFGFLLKAPQADERALDGDFTVQARVTRAPNLAHAALADEGEQFVWSAFVSGGERHGVRTDFSEVLCSERDKS